MEDVLLTEDRGKVRILTLNRPTKLNAINADVIHALTDALHRAQDDDNVHVIILTGSGRAFSAGADLSAGRRLSAETRRGMIKHGDAMIALVKLLQRVDKPIIAAVHGYALGAGAGLAFGSDMVVASENARFGYPELKAGLAATTVTAHAAHLLPRKVAFELVTLCDNMLPQRAYELGLINRVVPDGKHVEEAVVIAEKLAAWTPDQLWQTKRVFNRAAMMHPEAALEMARDTAVMMGKFPDPA